MKRLVVYYSLSGNTEAAARKLIISKEKTV